MSARKRGARLWLKPAWGSRKAVFLIKDGKARVTTGFGPEQLTEAERALANYIADKFRAPREKERDPDSIPIADVLSIYAEDKGDNIVRPKELIQRIDALLDFFENKPLSYITGATCREYALWRGSQSMARRELEDLRAAIGHHREEGLCNSVIEVSLPPKPEARDRWLTRSEAAALIWSAWRYREVQKGKTTKRRSRQHIARFILVGIYTGTRSSAICNAALTPAVGRGYVDLERGFFHKQAIGVGRTKKTQNTARLPPRLLAHMRRWARLGISRSSVIEFGAQIASDGSTKHGRPIKGVRKAFARVAEDAAEATKNPSLAEVTPHVLRHTAASWGMQGGSKVSLLADYLGMSGEVLTRVYGHLHPDQHAEAHGAITGKPIR